MADSYVVIQATPETPQSLAHEVASEGLSAPAVARPAATSGPLSPEHLRDLELARERSKRIRRAVGVASFNGWTAGVFATVSLLIGIFSLTSLLVGVALAVVAYNELAGARLLRQFDERGPRRLGFNQIGLCGMLIVYAVWRIYATLTGPSPFDAALAAGGEAMPLIASIEHLQTAATLVIYGGLIVGTLLFQGGMAWYYFTRVHHIRVYNNETPQWLVDLQRTI